MSNICRALRNGWETFDGGAATEVKRCRLTRVDRARLQRLKPKHAEPLSNFGFNLNLRRYTEASVTEKAEWDAFDDMDWGDM